MKIVFEGSELKEGIIKVSLDGGFTFADYEIANVKESGIPLDDSQRYDKIKIKGPANVLKSLDIVSNVKLEGGQSSGSSDYEEVQYYAWAWEGDATNSIIFTRDDNNTAYRKRDDTEELTIFTDWDYTDDKSAIRTERTKGVFYRYPEGDVVVQEPKKTSFYSWSILEGRITESDGSLINPGVAVGTLYTTKNPEEENGPFIFYSIDDNDEVSIEFIQKSVGREFPFTEFKGQYCIYKDGNCIMFFGGVKQLNLEMASVPVEAINTVSPSTENYTSSVEVYDWNVYDGKVTESDGSIIEEGTFVEQIFTLSEPHIGEVLDFYRVDASGNISFCFSRQTYQMFPDAQVELLRKQIGAGNAEYTSNHHSRIIYFTTKPTPKSFGDWCM